MLRTAPLRYASMWRASGEGDAPGSKARSVPSSGIGQFCVRRLDWASNPLLTPGIRRARATVVGALPHTQDALGNPTKSRARKTGSARLLFRPFACSNPWALGSDSLREGYVFRNTAQASPPRFGAFDDFDVTDVH